MGVKPEEILATVEAAIIPLLTQQGFELLGREWVPYRGRVVLRLYIDRAGVPGSITIEDCAALSRDVSTLLDAEDLIHGPYVLEVSSPGINRPLRRLEHFLAVLGKEVRIKLREPVDGQRRVYVGTLEHASEEIVELNAGGQRVALPRADIERATLEHKFE